MKPSQELLAMSWTQLVYVSLRTKELSDSAIDTIVAESARRNAERGVTGALLVCGNNIMQLLEGDDAVVEALCAKIAADPRHTDVHVLLRKQVAKRLCPQWGMKQFDPADEQAPLDRRGLARMIADIQSSHDTCHYSIEARVLLSEFREQLISSRRKAG